MLTPQNSVLTSVLYWELVTSSIKNATFLKNIWMGTLKSAHLTAVWRRLLHVQEGEECSVAAAPLSEPRGYCSPLPKAARTLPMHSIDFPSISN